MKRVFGAVAATLVSASLMVGVVAADTTTTTCSIYETGSESYNSCTTDSTQEARVTCDNNIYVLDNNSQDAGTGGVVVTNNGNGGDAVSGSALNENNQTVTIGAACESQVASTPTPTPTTPTTTTTTTTTPTTPAATQVVAPAGSVHAGGGAGSRFVSAWSITGLAASASIIGLGVALRVKRGLAR